MKAYRICVFYSKGRSFADVLQAVKDKYPSAAIEAWIPRGYPASAEEKALATELLETEQALYSVRQPEFLLRLISQLRAKRYDLFLITFNSPKLQTLAALSGAAAKAYCGLDGRLWPIRPSVGKVLGDVACRAVRGRLTYAWIWLAVRCLKVEPTAQ